MAIEIDGHAENAAASVRGGLVVAARLGRREVVESLELDQDLRFVLVIPHVELATSQARKVLPSMVPREDAVANLSRLGLLIAGLADHHRLVPEATEDRLHQPYRSALLPFADGVMAAMREGGALGACWSGAGSTLLGLVTASSSASVVAAAEAALGEADVPGDVEVVEADRTGLVLQ
jgi:homoserine kinase